MNKNEFLKMMFEDIATESEPEKTLYTDVIECMDIALLQTPITFDVPSDKTVKGAFEIMKKIAKERQKNGIVCIGPFETVKILAEYLGTKYECASMRYSSTPVNIEDFI